MEVQLPQQSVQINLNNKIITLHNVTIVKNPRIVKVDAAQYSNLLLKGAPIKLVNGTTNALKLPLPSLVPMKTPALVKTTPSVNQTSTAASVIVNQTPVIKPATNFVPNQLIRSFQNAPPVATNGTSSMQVKPMLFAQQNSALVSPVKIQTIPVKPTVIISPQKTTEVQAISPTKLLTSPDGGGSSNLQQHVKIHFQTNTQSPPPLQTISPAKQAHLAPNQTSVITKPTAPVVTNVQASSPPPPLPLNVSTPVYPIKTKVIVSPPLKTKSVASEECPLPEAKKPCTKLEFQCMFCKEIFFDEPQLLVEHINKNHSEKIPPADVQPDLIEQKEQKENEEAEAAVAAEEEEANDQENNDINEETSMSTNENPAAPVLNKNNDEERSSSDSDSDSSSSDEDEDMMEDDDESEVNDLIMDLEDTQENESDTGEKAGEDEESDGSDSDDSVASSQDRTNTSTPESPEFEEHIPSQNDVNEKQEEAAEQYGEDDYDIDLLCLLLEPIVDLQYENEEEEHSQEESEAMKLYREAMEINYQQNGIKKRGRRKSRTPKINDSMAMNGILANLLDTPIKIPQGPGRGRRKEVNEQELEADRNSGICFFQCTQCDKSFKLVGDLARHTRSHTISSPYRCSICSKVFTHIGSLNTHLRIHSGERPYKCKFCDKSFTQSNSLMVHVKSHLSNKPFCCTQCNKGFLNASSLALHQKTHTGPTSVTCPIDSCGKEFRDNNLLEEHMQTHKQSMLYQCSQCLEKFEQACQLVQHVKSHIGDKPFQCTICSRSFTQPGSLNTHLRIHTGERPFSCTQCPKRFTQASSLSVHMKIHGEKEFKCDVCSKSYSQEAFLEKHKLKHKEESKTNGVSVATSGGRELLQE